MKMKKVALVLSRETLRVLRDEMTRIVNGREEQCGATGSGGYPTDGYSNISICWKC